MKRHRLRSLTMVWLIAVLLISSAPIGGQVKQANAASGGIVERVFTDKSLYSPGSTVTITTTIKNNTGSAWSGNVVLKIFLLESQVYTASKAASVSNGQSANVTFTWTAPGTDFRGYFVRIDAGSAGSGATAVDVSSDFTKYPRYGYTSEFPSSQTSTQSSSMINTMSQDYHLNAWQFYDWMWRHDKFFKRTGGIVDSSWQDLFNRTISWPTIQNQISAVHNVNGAALAYAMVYTGRENYSSFGVNPEWGIYQDPSHSSQLNVDFGNGSTYLWMFDPQNPSWQNYIHNEYKDAVNTAGFDGIQVDQMGQRNNVYDYNGSPIDLSKRFSPFLNQAKASLNANNAAKNKITFNVVDGTVNGWAANDVASNANVDFLFSEIWYLSNSYMQLKDYIDSMRAQASNKAMVLAAYMNYNENIGPRYEAETAALTGTAVNTNHAGYTGSGFVDQFASANDAVTFTVTAPESGDYSLVFRYGNGGTTATRNIYVDGVLQNTVFFEGQGSWDTWSHKTWTQVNLTAGTHTVKVAYDAANSGAVNLDSLTLGTFDDHSIRLADAMMAASGATHIELGDNNQMLAHEYYPDHSKSMRSSLKNAMKDHYNFITAYENLLFDANVVNNDAGSQFVQLTGVPVSGDGTGNTVWNIQKRTPDYNIVHLINLLNNDNQWRNSASQPTFKTNVPAKIYIGGEETISNVYAASPDLDHGSTKELAFTTGTDANGKYVSFTIPELRYWDMIYMKKTFSAPANDIYEAENAVKTGTAVNTNHAGYTGTGFVDQFATVNDGASFIVKAASDDDYALRFRYANGGSNAARDVFVDGKYAGTVSFKPTGSWGTWGYGELTVNLKQGYHSVILWYNSSNAGAINLDHLDLDKTYIWQHDRQITSVPAGYRLTFREGQGGWVHWGVNNWQNVTDSALAANGSADSSHDTEVSVGPFTAGTAVNFTFLWDDNSNGILETGADRWEGSDYLISVN
jgi:uncharacterized protein YegP (UPF0339 family)